MITAQHNFERERETAAASLRTFMRLPAPQRSVVILKDILGLSLEEVCEIIGGSLSAAKSALQRGRRHLRELAQEPEEFQAPVLAPLERALLVKYVESFNARDFDAIRLMLADDVKLDLVNRLRATGREQVGEHLRRNALAGQWRFAPGFVDGRPAMLVFDRHDPAGSPAYFAVLNFINDSVVSIRDFLFARYVLEVAKLLELR
jgi:RNA polymerase sigma-70 factor (ECF subfamily)